MTLNLGRLYQSRDAAAMPSSMSCRREGGSGASLDTIYRGSDSGMENITTGTRSPSDATIDPSYARMHECTVRQMARYEDEAEEYRWLRTMLLSPEETDRVHRSPGITAPLPCSLSPALRIRMVKQSQSLGNKALSGLVSYGLRGLMPQLHHSAIIHNLSGAFRSAYTARCWHSS